MTRPIDADDLKKELFDFIEPDGTMSANDVIRIIDNAQTVPLTDFKEGYKQAIIDGKTNYSYSSIICGNCKYVDVARNRKPCCACKWLERESYYEEVNNYECKEMR